VKSNSDKVKSNSDKSKLKKIDKSQGPQAGKVTRRVFTEASKLPFKETKHTLIPQSIGESNYSNLTNWLRTQGKVIEPTSEDVSASQETEKKRDNQALQINTGNPSSSSTSTLQANIREITSADDLVGIKAINMRKANKNIDVIKRNHRKKLNDTIDNKRTLADIIKDAKELLYQFEDHLDKDEAEDALICKNRMINDARIVKDKLNIPSYNTAIDHIKLEKKDIAKIRKITLASDLIGFKAKNIWKARENIYYIRKEHSKKLNNLVDDGRTLGCVLKDALVLLSDFETHLDQGQTAEALACLTCMIVDAGKVKDTFKIIAYNTAIDHIELEEKDKANIREITSADDLIGFKLFNAKHVKSAINDIITNHPDKLDNMIDSDRTLKDTLKGAKMLLDKFKYHLDADEAINALSCLKSMVRDAQMVKDVFGIISYDTAINHIKLKDENNKNIREITSADDLVGLKATNMQQVKDNIRNIEFYHYKKLNHMIDNERTLGDVIENAKEYLNEFEYHLYANETIDAISCLTCMIGDAQMVKDVFGIISYDTAIDHIELEEKDKVNIREITSAGDLVGLKVANISQIKRAINTAKSNNSKNLSEMIDNKRTLEDVFENAKVLLDNFNTHLHADRTTEALSCKAHMISDAKKAQDVLKVKAYNKIINRIKLENRNDR